MIPSRLRLLLVSIGLSLATLLPQGPLLAQTRARTVLATMPISRTDLSWWRARHDEKLHEIARTRPDLIWLGDSITQDWELKGPEPWRDFAPAWQRFYGDRNAVNLGFKGDTTSSLIWRIRNGEVANIEPKVAIILIGANNLGRVHWSAEDTVAGIDTIIQDLHQRLPNTKLLLLGVLPSERSAWITETTNQINAALAQRYGHAKDVTYMDVSALFMRGSKLNTDLFLDPKLTPPDPPLHPTADGQMLIAKAIEPILSTLLHDRPHN